jgi:hypothetical protein
MVLLGVVIGLLLGAPFGLLLGGLCEANGEDSAVTDAAPGVTFNKTGRRSYRDMDDTADAHHPPPAKPSVCCNGIGRRRTQ